MRPKSMILIVIAMGCGLVASIGISQVMERRSQGTGGQIETGKVFVASTDVPSRETLSAQMVALEEWPLDRIPDGAITKIEDIEGMRPRAPLYAGEVILRGKIVDPKNLQDAPAEKIPPGFRAFPVKVSPDSIPSGLVHPGDRVDVLVYFQQGRNRASARTKTILSDVTVFAVNDLIDRDTEADGNSIPAKTVSLLVKPQQVETLELAKRLGDVSLSLRNTNDDSNSTTDGASVEDLNQTQIADLAASTTEPKPHSPSSLLDYLNAEAAKPPKQPIQKLKTDFHKTEIHTPQGVEIFHFDEEGALPRELREAGGPQGLLEPTLPEPPDKDLEEPASEEEEESAPDDDTIEDDFEDFDTDDGAS